MKTRKKNPSECRFVKNIKEGPQECWRSDPHGSRVRATASLLHSSRKKPMAWTTPKTTSRTSVPARQNKKGGQKKRPSVRLPPRNFSVPFATGTFHNGYFSQPELSAQLLGTSRKKKGQQKQNGSKRPLRI